MEELGHIYAAIDLKSFYASVECVERQLDPLTTNLVVADESRTEKTICLAVSPSLKAYGIPGRARLFEVNEKVRAVNAARSGRAPGRRLTGDSYDDTALKADPSLALSFIAAPPRMALYMAYSSRVYDIYLRYLAPEDIHVYSIDEAFLDVTHYLAARGLTARAFVQMLIREVLAATGITATAGIGTNLYLCKIAMDIVAKRSRPDADGVRIAELTEASYRKLLWTHRPLTDFWRVGRGYAAKLEANGLYTMGDVARCSVGKATDYYNEALLYRLFGVNAELLIDHAWGWEPCTMAEIKAYRPAASSLCAGQVLQRPYNAEEAALIVREMAEQSALDLVEKGLVTDQVVLTVGYDVENLRDPARAKRYRGPVTTDFLGRSVPKHAHGSQTLSEPTSSASRIAAAAEEIFCRTVNDALLIRRMYLTMNRVTVEGCDPGAACRRKEPEQLDLLTDYAARDRAQAAEQAALAREKCALQAVVSIRQRYGKNAILKGMSLKEEATAAMRNGQIGGHKA